jgi:hypothetical protein
MTQKDKQASFGKNSLEPDIISHTRKKVDTWNILRKDGKICKASTYDVPLTWSYPKRRKL